MSVKIETVIRTKLYDKDPSKWETKVPMFLSERKAILKSDVPLSEYRFHDKEGVHRYIKYKNTYVRQNAGIYIHGKWKNRSDGSWYYRSPFFIYDSKNLDIIERGIIE